jgi:hypothetical protein
MESQNEENEPNPRPDKLPTIKRWTELIRDVGLIIGIPTLIIIGSKMYGLQIESLKAQNEVLKSRNEILGEFSYDRALARINSQKKLFDQEREELESEIASLEISSADKSDAIAVLKRILFTNKERAKQFDKQIQVLRELREIDPMQLEIFIQSLIREKANERDN